MLRSIQTSCRLALLTVIGVLTAAVPARAELNLVSSFPSHGQAGVPTNAPIVLSFNAPLFPASVVVDAYPSCISLEPSTGGAGAVVTFQASLSADRRTLTLTHSVPFDDSRTYVLTLATAPASPCFRQDNASKTPLTPGPVPHAILFTTADDTPPAITSHTPADGGDLAPGTPINVSFTEPVVSESLDVRTDPPVPVSVTLMDGGRTLTILPTHSAFAIACSLSVYAEDASGNPLQASDAALPGSKNPWTVTLLPLGPDLTPPRLAAQSPAEGTSQADLLAPIVLRFSEAVTPADPEFPRGTAPLSVAPGGSGGAWSAVFSQDGTTLTLNHSEPLVPNTAHSVSVPAAALTDLSGNPLAGDIHLTFRTAEVTPPCIVASVPANGSTDIAGDAPLVILFSEPIQPASLHAELRSLAGSVVPNVTAALSEDGVTATFAHPPLTEDGSEYELVVLAAKDLSGADLVPGALPGNALRFRTRDALGPTLLSVQPANGAVVPADTTSIMLTFSEPIRPQSPVLRLAYLSGEPGPQPIPAYAQESDPGVWHCTGAWSADGRTLTIELQPLRTGDVVIAELIHAEDASGNPLRQEGAPTLWSFKVSDAGPPVLLELSPQPGDLVGLNCPVVIRTSKPLSSDTFRFEADGDWSQCAALISGKTWKAGRRAFSSDGKVITLTHTPFPDSPPGQQTPHSFRIISAQDAQFQNLVAAPGVSFETTFFTGSRPRVEKLQFRWPQNARLTVDGLLPAGGELEWRDLSSDPNCVVPRNSPLRVVFSQQMDPASVPPLVSDPSLGTWQLQWEPGCQAVVMSHSQPFPEVSQQWSRGQNGEITPPPPPLTLSLTYGLDWKGDALYPYTTQLRPADAAPPSLTLEYLRNPLPDGGIPPIPDWAPLDGASGVPVNTTLRICSTETLAPDGIVVANEDSAGHDIAQARPVISDRADCNGIVGSMVLVRFAVPLSGGDLVGDPPVEQRAAYSIAVSAADASPLANTARVCALFYTLDTLPPRLASISLAHPDNPRAGLLLTFTEPIAPDSLAVADLDPHGSTLPGLGIAPTGQATTFLLSFSPPPNPPGTELAYTVQVLPGAADTAGNVQQDPRLLNDPHGQSDRISILIPPVPGDIDGDGRLSTADVLLLFRFFAGIGTPTPGQLRAAGATGPRPTASDVCRLLRMLVSS